MVEESKSDKAFKDWKMQMWLGQECYERGEYVVAEQKFKKALTDLQAARITDERLAMTLNNLALCYCAQGKHRESDPLYQRALAIDESLLGEHKLLLADDFFNIATHYRLQGMNAQAETLYERSLKICLDELGESSAEVGRCLNSLGVLYCGQGRCDEAISNYKKALSIRGSQFGTRSKEYAETLVNLATTYCQLDRCEEADPLFEEGIRTLEYTVDPVHPELLGALESYVTHLRKTGQTERADQVAKEITRLKSKNRRSY